MALSSEKIAELLAKPDKTPRGRKAAIDFSQPDSRTYGNWFSLAHKLFDQETQEFAKCSNPECIDSRDKPGVIAEVNNLLMCRICFMDGYGLGNNGS